MKNFILSLLFLLAFLNSFGQNIPGTYPPVSEKDYLKLSRDQKTGGLICLGLTGVVIAIAAPGKINFDALPILAGLGVASAITSIPLFIASGRNKRKARLMATSQKTAFGMLYRDSYINGITIKWPLGK